ncbi:IclR family transcriptional regulator [Sporomusa acidovorans]|uniref:Pectin degradation repressor protein KdgR n=1 Tax=Sporomusa acidovorans (strain ATCC 49682 / DSM 3132 / Mol) TaxID=1123286 RepID=A0ABZ3J0J5_SPOA4|nr:IclR family transcriptional regulator [Sporomusa acidovorans]OZC13371.1 pectin degradation repressor protein KdgR [Sporomusa acidovorans DSM 3132]SDF53376.1 transcriptional regulator, IclR family [Sporomusa acidovorans]
MKKNEGKSDYINALANGLSVLECFKDTDEFGITEIGDIANLPGSSVQRIVHTLEMKGYLYQNSDNKKYRLTPKILLFYPKSEKLVYWKEQAKKHMITLNEFCGENVNLALRHDDMCSYIELIESKQLLRPHFTIGDVYPTYCTSLGRSLLSDKTDQELELLLPEVLDARTAFTITDRSKVIEKIKEIGQRKYGIDDEEFYLGLRCVGSPIYGIGNKVIAALSVIAPNVRMDEETINKLIPKVIDTAQNISQEYKKIFS